MNPRDFRSLFGSLLDATQERLAAFEAELELPLSLELYRQALLAFLGGNAPALRALLHVIEEDTNAWSADFPALPRLVKMRLDYLRGSPLSSGELPADALAQAEISMLLAASDERAERFAPAIQGYKAAAKLYRKAGVTGKSLRARFNAVTLTSHVDPSQNLVREYFFLYREARKLKQFTVMAAALLNISREYQRLGAFAMALKFANKSVACAAPDLGGQIHFLAVAHRGHCLRDLGRDPEARVELEHARTAPFPEVHAACAVLAALLGDAPAEVNPKELVRTWRERVHVGSPAAGKMPKFSAGEEKLLEFVSARPRSKFDLIEHLFGEKLDPFAAENRLKNVIFRLRKKAPGLLLFADGAYFLAGVDSPRRTG